MQRSMEASCLQISFISFLIVVFLFACSACCVLGQHIYTHVLLIPNSIFSEQSVPFVAMQVCSGVCTVQTRTSAGKTEGRGGELRSPASSRSSSELSKAQELVVLSAWLLQLCVQHYGSCSCFTHTGASKDTTWDAQQKQTYPEPWHFLEHREWPRQKHLLKSKESRVLHAFLTRHILQCCRYTFPLRIFKLGAVLCYQEASLF